MSTKYEKKISIVGKNGAYIIEDGRIDLVVDTKSIKGKRAVNYKFLEAIRVALQKARASR